MQMLSGSRRRAALLLAAVLLLLTSSHAVLMAQNLGAAPQVNVAVQGQTGAQPEGAFLNLVNWIGNVIAPVGAGLALAGGLVTYMSGRGAMRYVVARSDVWRLGRYATARVLDRAGRRRCQLAERKPGSGSGARPRAAPEHRRSRWCHRSFTTSCASCCF